MHQSLRNSAWSCLVLSVSSIHMIYAVQANEFPAPPPRVLQQAVTERSKPIHSAPNVQANSADKPSVKLTKPSPISTPVIKKPATELSAEAKTLNAEVKAALAELDSFEPDRAVNAKTKPNLFTRRKQPKEGQKAASDSRKTVTPAISAVAVEAQAPRALPVFNSESEVTKPNVSPAKTILNSPSAEQPVSLVEAQQYLSEHEYDLFAQTRYLVGLQVGLAASDRSDLLQWLMARKQVKPGNRHRHFSFSFANVTLANQLGSLFPLRQINNRLKTADTALAYAVALIHAENMIDKVDPSEVTLRKMAIGSQLEQASKRHAIRQKEGKAPKGFWPLLAKTVEPLLDMPAYQPVLRTDLSRFILPQGNRRVQYESLAPSLATPLKPILGVSYDAMAPQCSLKQLTSAEYQQLQQQTKIRQTLVLDNSRPAYDLLFSADKGSSTVTLINPNREQVGQFISPVGHRIIEDIDHDGVFELVVRQYAFKPTEPVIVYRLTHCGLQRDKAIDQLFL